MRKPTLEHMEVLVTEPGQLHELLDNAEAELRQAARCRRSGGIVVTRHDHTRYTLTLSDTVPFGETRELTLS
ncbi:hypothetical protein B8W73_02870 [Arthrobacter agilis]|nr:hypothetical protein B8W73_02870 [Arthrobacter agilis]